MARADHGELQQSVLNIVWLRDTCTVRQVHELLSRERPVAYTTVLTVMTRLVERGLLQREARGNVGVFKPVRSDDPAAAGRLVDQLIGRYGTVGVTEFVARARAHPELHDALRRVLENDDE